MFNAFDAMNHETSYWFVAWLRERIMTGMWWLVPLSLGMTLAGGSRDWFFRTAATMFSLAVLRLWDDYEDVTHDRAKHPERVLCRLESSSAVTNVCHAGILISVFVVIACGERAWAYVAIVPLLRLAKWSRSRLPSQYRGVVSHVILLKIPALVLGLSQIESRIGVVSWRAVGLYGLVSSYEVLHDSDVRRGSWMPVLFFLDMVCLVLGLGMEFIGETTT